MLYCQLNDCFFQEARPSSRCHSSQDHCQASENEKKILRQLGLRLQLPGPRLPERLCLWPHRWRGLRPQISEDAWPQQRSLQKVSGKQESETRRCRGRARCPPTEEHHAEANCPGAGDQGVAAQKEVPDHRKAAEQGDSAGQAEAARPESHHQPRHGGHIHHLGLRHQAGVGRLLVLVFLDKSRLL